MSFPYEPAAIPSNEAERLMVLRNYEILDTSSQEIFDDYTWLASRICDVPTALISLVDKNRQWFKSRVGLDVLETPTPSLSEVFPDIFRRPYEPNQWP